MSYTTILYEVDDRVARITLNRPHRMNALTLKLCAEFQDALAVADRDPEARVVVVAGAGGRAFSSGFDFDDEDEKGQDKWRTIENWKKRHTQDVKFNYSVFNCSKPVIAMIDGYCLAGGLEFVQMFDIRYCSDKSCFGVTETRFAAGVLTLAMPWLIGQHCREPIYTGDLFDAQEAHRLGLVSRVFPKDQLEKEVTRIAKRMSRVAMPTLMWNKKTLNNALIAGGLESALRYGAEACVLMECWDSEFKQFRELQQRRGGKAAMRWRDAVFGSFESETSWVSSRAASSKQSSRGQGS